MEARPRAFLLENVPGLAGRHLPYLLKVLSPLADRYEITSPEVINAADFGVPQKRRRMVVVGIEKGRQFKLPTRAGGKPPASGDLITPHPVGEPNESKVVYCQDARPAAQPIRRPVVQRWGAAGRSRRPGSHRPCLIWRQQDPLH
jgi:DNA (cytosine-5)-methyltransferase 1